MATLYRFKLADLGAEFDEYLVILLANDGFNSLTVPPTASDPSTDNIVDMPNGVLIGYKDSKETQLGLQQAGVMELEFNLNTLSDLTDSDLVTFYDEITNPYGNPFEVSAGETLTYFLLHNIIKIRKTADWTIANNFRTDMKNALLYCFAEPNLEDKFDKNKFQLKAVESWKKISELMSFLFVGDFRSVSNPSITTNDCVDALFEYDASGDLGELLLAGNTRNSYSDGNRTPDTFYLDDMEFINDRINQQSKGLCRFLFHKLFSINMPTDPNYLFKIYKEAGATNGVSDRLYPRGSRVINPKYILYYDHGVNPGTFKDTFGLLQATDNLSLFGRYKTLNEFYKELFSATRCIIEIVDDTLHIIPSPILDKLTDSSSTFSSLTSNINFESVGTINFDATQVELNIGEDFIGSISVISPELAQSNDPTENIKFGDLETETITVGSNLNNDSLDIDILFHTYPKEISGYRAEYWDSQIGSPRRATMNNSDDKRSANLFSILEEDTLTVDSDGVTVSAFKIYRRVHISCDYIISSSETVTDNNAITPSDVAHGISTVGTWMSDFANDYNAILATRIATHGVGYILGKAYTQEYGARNIIAKVKKLNINETEKRKLTEKDLGRRFQAKTNISNLITDPKIAAQAKNELILIGIENDYFTKEVTHIFFVRAI